MMQDIFDSELWKALRSMVPALLIVMIVLTAVIGYFVKVNSDELASQEAQILSTQQEQALQSAQFGIFLKTFTAEGNYECRIDEYIAAVYHLPPPRSGTCSVVAP